MFTSFRLCFALALIVFPLAFLPQTNPSVSQALEPAWSAWLYNDATQKLVQVFGDGTSVEYALPLADWTVLQSDTVAFDPTGSWIVFCSEETSGSRPTRLEMRPIFESPKFPRTINLGNVVECNVRNASFAGEKFAMGVLNYLPDPEGICDERPMWEVLIVDLPSQTIEARLRADDPIVTALQPFGCDTPSPLLPRINSFDTVIDFQLQLYGSDAWGTPEGYVWNPTANTLERNPRVNALHFALLPTNDEHVWATIDEDAPQAPVWYPLQPFNTVLCSAQGSDPYPIFQLDEEKADLIIEDIVFAKGGEWVLVHLDDFRDTPGMWLGISRSGLQVQFPIAHFAAPVYPTNEGYVYATFGEETGHMHLINHALSDTGEVTETILWESCDCGWTLVWTTPITVPADLAPFTPLE